MQPGKILFVANTDWYLYNFRPALAHFMRSKGFEVIMVSPAGPFLAELQNQGFRCIEWRVGRRTMSPLVELQSIYHLYQIFRQEKPQLVHHFTIKPVIYGSIAARLARVPLVVNSVTGLGYIFLLKGWKGQVLRSVVMPFYRLGLSRQGTWVIFENGNDRETLMQLGLVTPLNSSIINGVGVDTTRFSPTSEPDSNQPLVVFPARMLIDKGVNTLVEAARILNSNSSIRIALVGEPDPGNPATVDEATLRSWEQEGLVEWWGFRRDMEMIYQNCHIVTLPSYGEGLPTVLIEAAACSRPIITTDVPGCRDVVIHGVNGLLVPPGDARALAEALRVLVADAGLRQRMGAAGRQIVMERFTDSKVVSETYAVYQHVLNSRTSENKHSPQNIGSK